MKDEPTVSTQNIYEGKIIKVRVDEVIQSDGKLTKREIVEHPGSVGIVAILDNKQIILVEQYRKPVNKHLLEIPAGKIDNKEDPIECAKRELLEETGYKAENWLKMFTLYTSPGFSNEKMVLYLATKLSKINIGPKNPFEISSIKLIDIDEVLQKVIKKEIEDGKTVTGVLAAKQIYKF